MKYGKTKRDRIMLWLAEGENLLFIDKKRCGWRADWLAWSAFDFSVQWKGWFRLAINFPYFSRSTTSRTISMIPGNLFMSWTSKSNLLRLIVFEILVRLVPNGCDGGFFVPQSGTSYLLKSHVLIWLTRRRQHGCLYFPIPAARGHPSSDTVYSFLVNPT